MGLVTYRFGEFAPDQGPYFGESDGKIDLLNCRNVIPVFGGYSIADNAYSIQELQDQVDFAGNTKAIYAYINPAGTGFTKNEWLFASGTTNKIYQVPTNGAQTDISRAGNYTNADFKFTKFGPTLLATNDTDAIQRGAIGAVLAKNNDISGTPAAADPRAKYIEKFKAHLFLGNIDLTAGSSGTAPETYGGAFGPLLAQEYPEMIWWSAQNNERRFGEPNTTSAIIGSDFRRFYDDLGEVTGLKSCNDYLAVFRERGVGIVTGPPFGHTIISEHLGCLFPNSITRSGSDIYFWSSSGPARIINGETVELLGEGKVSKWISEIWTNASSLHSITSNLISAASTIDGKYIVWSIRNPIVNGTSNLPTYLINRVVALADAIYNYNYMLVYSIYSDSFTLCTEGELGTYAPITSYYLRNVDYSRFAGISGIGNTLNTIGPNLAPDVTVKDFLCISEYEGLASGGQAIRNNQYINGYGSYDSTPENSYPSLKTKYIKFPGNSEESSTFRFLKIRPIIYMEGDRGRTNVISDILKEIRIYPRMRYEGRDTTTILEDAPVDTNAETYISFTGQDVEGWIMTDGCPYSQLNAIEFIFHKDYNNRLIYGFDAIFDLGPQYSASGKELTAI